MNKSIQSNADSFTEKQITEIRRDFPVTQDWIYMNHAGVAPISRRVAERMAEFNQDMLDHGAAHSLDWERDVATVRSMAAKLINAEPADIAFLKNTAEGINIIAHGIDWKPGDNVVVMDRDYPSNIYPWVNLEDRGVELRCVAPIDGVTDAQRILDAFDSRTRCASITFVDWCSGHRLELQTIGEACEERDILFLVDPMQGLGAFELDVKKSRIGALPCGAWKWLLGPTGVAIFYCPKPTRERIRQQFVGADCVVDAENYLDYDFTLLPSAKRFEYAMLDYAAIMGLGGALEQVESVTGDMTQISPISDRVLDLTQLLIDKAAAKGYKHYGPADRSLRSGIVSIEHERHPAREVRRRLYRESVLASVRDGRVRLAPHYYMTEDEIMRVVDLLPE